MLFEYTDPIDYLKYYIETNRSVITGVQSRIAEAANCQPAYLSQILKRKASLSPEQAEAVSRFLGHSPREIDYFLLITQAQRAGTAELTDHYWRKINESRLQYINIKKRLDQKKLPNLEISESVLSQYYQTWLVGAVHVALGCPQLRTTQSLAKYFMVSESKISFILGFLENSQLATKSGEKWKTLPFVYHLERGSVHLHAHLKNGYLCALGQTEKNFTESDLTYNAYMTLSKEDVFKIKNIILEGISKAVNIAKESEDEGVFLLNISLLGLGVS